MTQVLVKRSSPESITHGGRPSVVEIGWMTVPSPFNTRDRFAGDRIWSVWQSAWINNVFLDSGPFHPLDLDFSSLNSYLGLG